MRALLSCLLLVPPAAFADYWVALASLDSRTAAETVLVQAGGRVAEPLTVMPAETAAGTHYRVLAGPYASRTSAEESLAQVRVAGFADAWLYEDASALEAPLGDPLATGSGSLLDFDEPLPSTSPDTLPEREAQDLPSIVTEAPPGYRLNRLRRDPPP